MITEIERYQCLLTHILAEIELIAEAPLAALLRQLHGWPVVESSWSQPRQYPGLERLMGRVRDVYSSSTLLQLLVATDDKNSSRRVLQVDDVTTYAAVTMLRS